MSIKEESGKLKTFFAICSSIFIIAAIFLTVTAYVNAQSAGSPPGAAPNNGLLNNFSSGQDFVSLTASSTVQRVNGPLIFASSTVSLPNGYGAIIGDYHYTDLNAVGLTGYAGVTSGSYRPAALRPGTGGSAVYGYATNNTGGAYGVYGYGSGASATAVVGKITNYTAPKVIVNPDTAASVKGDYSSMTIGIDGLPIITYSLGSDRRVLHCSKTDCSDTANNIATTVDTHLAGHDLGQYSSIEIGSDGLPIIAYYDSNGACGVTGRDKGSLKILHCGKIDCSDISSGTATQNKITTLDTEPDNVCSVGRYNSLAIGTDGLPVISYWRDNDRGTGASADALRVLHCSTVDCSVTSSNSIVAVDTGTVSGDYVGQYTSMAIGTDGFPVIAYMRRVGGADRLLVVHCRNIGCSGTVDKTDLQPAHEDIRLAIAFDGRPLIAYSHNTGNGSVNVIHCTDVQCSGIDAGPTLVSSFADETNLAIGQDGMPLITFAYSYVTNPTEKEWLEMTRCGDIKCANASIFSTTIIDSSTLNTYDVGHNNSLAVGPDGYRGISYQDRANSNLKFIHFCGTFDCLSGGSSNGMAGKFFGPFQAVYGAGTPADPSLRIQTQLSAPYVRASSTSASIPAVNTSSGILVSGQFSRALDGQSPAYGILGLSTSGTGLKVNNVIAINNLGTIAYGIYGATQSASDGAGIFGWSTNGNGVAGIVGNVVTANTPKAAYATSPNTNTNAAALYVQGGAFAGYFEGDMTVATGNKVCIGTGTAIPGFTTICFDETGLKKLLKWCTKNKTDNTNCPDSCGDAAICY